MIVQVDHIAFGSADVGADAQWLESLGYRMEFREPELQDLENKRPWMERFSGELDMALMAREGSLRIELLDHGHTAAEGSYVAPIFEGDVGAVRHTGERLDADGRALRKARAGRASFWTPEVPAGGEFRCAELIAGTNDVRASAEYWTGFGFKTVRADDETALLEFRAMLGREAIRLRLRRLQGGAPSCRLDSEGFNCLAFLSSAGEKDWKRFEDLGRRPSPMNPMRVNGKDLRIFWVPGPSGEAAEVISLA